MATKRTTSKKNGAKVATKKKARKKAPKPMVMDDLELDDFPPGQQDTPFEFKAKPGTWEAILEAAAFSKKAGLDKQTLSR